MGIRNGDPQWGSAMGGMLAGGMSHEAMIIRVRGGRVAFRYYSTLTR